MPSANAPTTTSSPKTSAIAVVDDDDALRLGEEIGDERQRGPVHRGQRDDGHRIGQLSHCEDNVGVDRV